MTLEAYVQGFGCVPDPTPYDEARAVVIPVPLDWGRDEHPGVSLGPMAILGASRFIETYDAGLGVDALQLGVATLDALELSYSSEERPLAQIEGQVSAVVGDGKFPLCLGGERTIALAGARAARRHHGEVGVVKLSRRAALLERSNARRLSPRTVGRRLLEEGPLVLLGQRIWTGEEAELLAQGSGPAFASARQLEVERPSIEGLLSGLPEAVYLSIDVGVLDPAYLPMEGNIEPGGLTWFGLLGLLDVIFGRLRVVGCDVVGFVPTLGQIAPSVVAAQLALQCLTRALLADGALER